MVVIHHLATNGSLTRNGDEGQRSIVDETEPSRRQDRRDMLFEYEVQCLMNIKDLHAVKYYRSLEDH